MCFAAKVLYHQKGDNNSASILKEILKDHYSDNGSEKRVLLKITPLRAALMILSTNLSKSDYQHMKNLFKDQLPGYDSVLKAKKECSPSGVQVLPSEHCAMVPLKNALDHTAQRICDSSNEVIHEQVNTENQKRLILNLNMALMDLLVTKTISKVLQMKMELSYEIPA